VVAATAVTALAALLVQPVTAAPSYAGEFCDLPVPVPGDDCTAPETKLTGTPDVDDHSETEARDAAFDFTTEAPEPGVTFECTLTGPSQAHDWADCTTPAASGATTSNGSRSYDDLALGDYTFSVRATDAAAGTPNTEQTPATFSWTVVEADGPPPPDTEDPDTVITSGADRWHPFSYLGITYDADEHAGGFRCTLNKQDRSCGDDQVNFFGMKAGDYLFTVAAVDDAGNVDPTPAVERWSVPMNNTLFAKHSKEWEKRQGRGYFQDTYSITHDRGAFIEQAKQGFRSLVLVATRCPGCGAVDVFLKDVKLRTIDLSSTSTDKRQIIPVASWRKPHAGRVRLVVTTQDKDVIIEGLGFSARR
jgi:hypothetical protein